MGTISISLRGADAKAFVEAWREGNLHPTGPRTVICTRCNVVGGEPCKSMRSKKPMWGFHRERVKLELRVRALVILRKFGPITAAGFAGWMWPEGNPRFTAGRAAIFLRTLWREGFAMSCRGKGSKIYVARRKG